ARSGLEIPGVMTEPVEPGRDLHVHPGHPGVGIAGQSSDYDDAEWRHEGWDLSPAWINEVRRRVSRQTELTADLAQLGPAASAPRPQTTTEMIAQPAEVELQSRAQQTKGKLGGRRATPTRLAIGENA